MRPPSLIHRVFVRALKTLKRLRSPYYLSALCIGLAGILAACGTSDPPATPGKTPAPDQTPFPSPTPVAQKPAPAQPPKQRPASIPTAAASSDPAQMVQQLLRWIENGEFERVKEHMSRDELAIWAEEGEAELRELRAYFQRNGGIVEIQTGDVEIQNGRSVVPYQLRYQNKKMQHGNMRLVHEDGAWKKD